MDQRSDPQRSDGPEPEGLPAFEPPIPWLVSGMDDEEAALVVGLGLLVRSASLLEYVLHGLLAHLREAEYPYALKEAKSSGTELAGECLKTLQAKRETLRAQRRGEPVPAWAIDALVHDLRLCEDGFDERNRYVHGAWSYVEETRSWVAIKGSRVKGAVAPERHFASDADVWKLAAELERLQMKLTAWDVEFYGEQAEDDAGKPVWVTTKRLGAQKRP